MLWGRSLHGLPLLWLDWPFFIVLLLVIICRRLCLSRVRPTLSVCHCDGGVLFLNPSAPGWNSSKKSEGCYTDHNADEQESLCEMLLLINN